MSRSASASREGPASGQHLVAAPVDDGVLIARARAGDERAFATLYHRHARYLAGVAYRLLGDAAELDDVVQDTFVIAARSLGSLKEPEALRGWLVTIAVRQVHRRLASRARRRWLGQESLRQSARVSDPSVAREVEELYDVLDRVAVRLRIPWILARIEGEQLPDVAAACDVSLATVKRRIAEAEEIIRRRLGHG